MSQSVGKAEKKNLLSRSLLMGAIMKKTLKLCLK